jgi:hypothetical protein
MKKETGEALGKAGAALDGAAKWSGTKLKEGAQASVNALKKACSGVAHFDKLLRLLRDAEQDYWARGFISSQNLPSLGSRNRASSRFDRGQVNLHKFVEDQSITLCTGRCVLVKM